LFFFYSKEIKHKAKANMFAIGSNVLIIVKNKDKSD